MVIMAEIDILRCGVKFDPPAIMVVYNDKKTKKHRQRTMPLRDFTKDTSVDTAMQDLLSHSRHGKYVSLIPKPQFVRLVTIIRDKLNGLSLEASLARNDAMDKIDPEENLNTVDEETLKRKKAVMDQTFEKHRVKPGDPNFQYDVEVDFDAQEKIESGWDSDEGSDLEF